MEGVETPETPQPAPAGRPTVVLDADALTALAHPIRLRVMRLLRLDGPATASGLAARMGESSGLTSYHLRKLADVGLVEEDPERGDRRDRWWRSVHEGTRWSTADFLGNGPAYRASQEMRRSLYRWQLSLLENWLEEEAEWDDAWVDAAGTNDDLLELTPSQLTAMNRELWEVVQRYRTDPPPAAPDEPVARVLWLQHSVPLADELPL